jgi:acyl transferase domain-containing protein/thioesterase domain-containing protein/NADP-dependent 3-hydroxy acid dehydrogenase YdfG/acyl carrier protein
MSDLAQRLAGLSPAQRRLLEQRLAKARPAAPEPVAIVGMACRFPGAPDLRAYWRLIREGVSAVTEVPPDRWNADEFYDPTGETPGKMSVRWAALVEGPDQFDPQFFGITPREASRMDPQQRLLLEVAWEAMENAGRPAEQLAGSRTGVFIGIGGTDYTKICVPYDNYYEQIDAHLGTGNALSIAANRLSYIFDFHGPSAAVDTACSSSSLAIHLAVESLRRGESDAALAGGVNMILTPETTIAFSKARMLSPEGVCRPFDARANGYVRGEGCGLVLLKRLADATRDGDRVFGVLRASSVNQDGRTSGISAPNGKSQLACIRAALMQAALQPDDIDYVEAHGTGTPLGDPIEMQALAEIFRADDHHGAESRRDSEKEVSAQPPQVPPCYVASVKANVGHMETVSGVAGLIKVVLMLEHEEIPRQTHFESLNPHVNLDGTRLAIPTQSIGWRRGQRRRRAGVSSFGFGGTNTHLVVEAADDVKGEQPLFADRPLHVLKLSAKSDAALKQQAARLAEHLRQEPAAAVADICWSANTGRTDFHRRAAIVAQDSRELEQRLRGLAAGEAASAAGTKHGSVRSLSRPKVAFLFTGQGSQYVGMGRQLYDSHPVFRGALDQCEAILRGIWGGESLLDVLYPAAEAAAGQSAGDRLHQTRYTQPALFALEFALAQLWASWGVVPDVVLGHSVGEYAAACVAGMMSLEDGLALIAERARLMQNVRRHGKMAVVFAAPDRVASELAQAQGAVVVAVINGPENTVISGEAAGVDAAAAKLTAAGVQVKPLNVSHAFHSPLMDEMLEEFEQFAAGIDFQPPHVPLASNLTGQMMSEPPTARYWRDHLRNKVQFAQDMSRIAELAPAMILEIGPTASLLGMGRRCLPDFDAAWLPSFRENQACWQVLAASVAEYYVRGGQIDWRGWDQPWPRERLLLPTYPFQRSRQWFELDPSKRRNLAVEDHAASAVGTAAGPKKFHRLLGTRLSTVWANTLFESRLSARSPAYLNDHQVQGSPVVPAAAYIEQSLAAADEIFGPGRHGVANLAIQQAMFLAEGTRRRVQISVAPESGGESAFECYSRPADDSQPDATWTMHATGSLIHDSRIASAQMPAAIDLEAAHGRAVSITSHEDFYALMSERGLRYGPAFRVLHDLHRGVDEAVARIELPESIVREAGGCRLHPVLGDALLQLMAGAVPLEEDGSFSPFTYMPVGIRSVQIRSMPEDFKQPLFAYAVRTSTDPGPSPERVEANVCLLNAAGAVLAMLEGVQVQRVGRSSGADTRSDSDRWIYRVAWQQQPLEAGQAAGRTGAWLIFADETGVGRQLAERLSQRGESGILVRPGQRLEIRGAEAGNGGPGHPTQVLLDPLDEAQYRELLETEFAARRRSCLGIVHLWSLDIPAQDANVRPADCWQTIRALGCGSALQLVRSLARSSLAGSTSLWIVTAGAQAVSEAGAPSRVAAGQSPLSGFGRVAAMELPDLRPRLIDLEASDGTRWATDAASALAAELSAPGSESEIAYRSGRRYVARLVRAPSALQERWSPDSATLAIPSGPCQLRIAQAGSLDALRFVPAQRQPPAAGHVELEIRATGLNFSDVLKALGLYPGIKDAVVPLGIEASGVVTAVGPGVDRFEIGDEVFGVVPYAFASHARTAEYALVHKAPSIGHNEACTIPITFLTAYYGLVRLAQLQPGERVLIHAGAGGVGLAAIQIAQHIGAEIFATAGSEAKRDFLRSLGVEHVYSSRSAAFAEEILADTERQGVDVVLNSLPGEAITKSLSILRAYGRFLEIGKTDIYQNRMIGLLPFQDNLSYFAIDLDRMLRQRPDYIRDLFAEVMRHFEAGHYRPLTFTQFAAERAVEAFRYMSQRKNIGKVVVSMASREPRAESREPDHSIAQQALVRRDGTYLITGGSGALGLQVAQWLAEQGAGTIVLLSRRGVQPQMETALAEIGTRGTKAVVLMGDVADAQSLVSALAELPGEGRPLRGVVHAAGVLADGVLAEMTLEQLDAPMSPKVQGAWNLHLATQGEPLDFFVMFSSVASVLGSPGQANYAAGNAYLDALAHFRRGQGLPATTINWGPWAGAGMAAEAGRSDQVKARGMALLEPRQALDLLGRILHSGVPQVAVMDAQWSDVLRLLGSRRPSLLASVAAEVEQSAGPQQQNRVDHAFRQRLLEADDQARHALVADYIRQELARIMGVDPATLVADQPLSTFGLDSLLALELKNNLESRLDFTLPMSKLMEGPSIASLSAEASRLLVRAASGAAEDGSRPARIVEATGEAWSPLLGLRSTGSRPPLVLLPALGGDVRCYAELAHQLGDEQPVYAFRPRGVDQDLPPHLTMEEMIEDYLAALRELQPAGPYYLGGWSTGGIFAFALAEALERSGNEVGLLAMFDTPLPSICDDVDVEDDAHFLCDILNYANRFAGTDVRFTYDALSSQGPQERFHAALSEARRQGLVPADTPESFIRRLVSVGEANVRVIQGYRPQPLCAPVHLFVPVIKTALAEVSGRKPRAEEDHGWSADIGQLLEIEEIPGDHFTMMVGAGVSRLADALTQRLSDGLPQATSTGQPAGQ